MLAMGGIMVAPSQKVGTAWDRPSSTHSCALMAARSSCTGATGFSITFQDVTLSDPAPAGLTPAELLALGIDVGTL